MPWWTRTAPLTRRTPASASTADRKSPRFFVRKILGPSAHTRPVTFFHHQRVPTQEAPVRQELGRFACAGVADELQHPSRDEQHRRPRPERGEDQGERRQRERQHEQRDAEGVGQLVPAVLVAGLIPGDPVVPGAVLQHGAAFPCAILAPNAAPVTLPRNVPSPAPTRQRRSDRPGPRCPAPPLSRCIARRSSPAPDRLAAPVPRPSAARR